ncbi:5'-3' exonuclease PLD3 [Corythoichthys intestinalis]|uniref:5'-3' exonuclease PLD3 n=1 Tax=Corythoichthys intestinalis TaxID=161448 RepID=UPI0025A59AFE|nr:5'-3' exonuclease PLD3 [Corythoichthys intestinalis]
MERPQTDGEEEEPDDMDLRNCSIMLERLGNKAAKREFEDKDDLSRKSAKPASRIPTMLKRPVIASPELPVSKKDPPAVVQPASADTSKSKLPEAREKTHPFPTVRIPRVGSEVPAILRSLETATGTAPKHSVLSEGLQPSLIVSPRPALRAEENFIKEEDNSHYPKFESSSSHLPCVELLSRNPLQEEDPQRPRIAIESNIPLKISKALPCIPDVSQAEAIVNEKPPWENEDPNAAESKSLKSSSDFDSEDDLAMGDCGDIKKKMERQASKIVNEDVDIKENAGIHDKSAWPVTAEQPVKTRSTKSTKRSGCGSLILRLLLPATLLLVAMHAWRFGIPMSVSQLAAHMELHWLEGMGPITEKCSKDCRVHLVESIPQGLYPSSPSPQQSTAVSWLQLLDKANSSVSIAAFYMSLRSNLSEFAETDDAQGRKVFEQLKQLPSKNVKLKIAVNGPQNRIQDTSELALAGAKIREVDMTTLTGGILHTKLLVIDQKHFYLGSANMDWRSLTQVKEVGLVVEDCSCLAQDAARIFEVYWSLNGSLPLYWPARFTALSSSQKPLLVNFNGVAAKVYFSSAPPQISARGRSDDLATILSVIDDARDFVFISVMDYLPLSEFTEPLRFWPTIDNALRAAACTRGVKVRLLVSCWDNSPAAMFTFLQSLLVLNRPSIKCDIEVKIFTVPSTEEQMKIPFARVNHAKYMVTERVLYIGTSNWSENYFTQTAGVSLVVNQTDSEVKPGQRTLQSQAEELFLRDWRSHYSSSLSAADVRACPRRPL